MPKGFPEHREVIALRVEPDDMFHTDSLWIAALKAVGDAQRLAFAFAPRKQKALVPPAWRQLIPNEGGNAARMAGRQPGWPVSARRALPPISGHEPPNETQDQLPRALGA